MPRGTSNNKSRSLWLVSWPRAKEPKTDARITPYFFKIGNLPRDQTKPENFFSLDEMANVTAREFLARGTRAVFFDGPFVPRELGVL